MLEMAWLFLNGKGDGEVQNGPNLGIWAGRRGTGPPLPLCLSHYDPAVDSGAIRGAEPPSAEIWGGCEGGW